MTALPFSLEELLGRARYFGVKAEDCEVAKQTYLKYLPCGEAEETARQVAYRATIPLVYELATKGNISLNNS